MAQEWNNPKWRQQGRTGPGPAAPRYAKGKDRRAVQRGGSPGDGKGCSVVAMALAGGVLAGIGMSAYAIVEVVKGLI